MAPMTGLLGILYWYIFVYFGRLWITLGTKFLCVFYMFAVLCCYLSAILYYHVYAILTCFLSLSFLRILSHGMAKYLVDLSGLSKKCASMWQCPITLQFITIDSSFNSLKQVLLMFNDDLFKLFEAYQI